MARRSKPNNGFPSKPVLGIQAQRVHAIMALMSSGQWGGKITEIGLAREWDLSLDYVAQLASQASANIQIALTPDFQSSLRARIMNAQMALCAKMSEYALNPDHHGSHDRYEASEDDGETWQEVPREKALDDDYRGAVKIRRIPCVAVGSIPALAQAAFKGWEGVARLAGVELDPRFLRQQPGSGGGAEGDDDGPRDAPREVKVAYTGVEPPTPPGEPPQAAPVG